MDREQWKGNMDLLILSILRQDDAYGFQIISKVNKLSEGSYQLSEGTLYSVLKRLERKKAISSYWGDESQGGRRKYYTITPLGVDVHQEKLNGWKQVNRIISEVNKEGEPNE
ncbi:PadR family transcriptional regulator [Evansella clarkii]|uniref:PadR family transcriptional regulator n=1 Tax=Evansella clarkii TaxID=79879 RepID=UPI000998B58C|nr:PadR family transcriptional regulator [Evansella clarkii]